MAAMKKGWLKKALAHIDELTGAFFLCIVVFFTALNVILRYCFDNIIVEAEELMERFVRGDSSRHTEGSGLGLNIARSLVELQKGDFRLYVDGDLFKAEILLDNEFPFDNETLA